MLTTGAWANETTIDGVTYSYSTSGSTATVIKIPSTATSLTIPATFLYDGKTYTVKNVSMIEANSTLTDLTIMGQLESFNGRTTLNDNAFANLKNLTFKQFVNEIREVSFYNNYTLESVKFEGGVNIIGLEAFYRCLYLKTIDFGTQLSEIQQLAFYLCSSLEEVVFPAEDWYVNIDKQAFYYCEKLAHVVFPDEMNAYWDYTLGDDCFTRSAKNIIVKTPYGRADYFRKFFRSDATYEEYPSPITFSLPAGTYDEVQTVEIANTWGTEIYYTTDGTDPLVNGQKYTGPITVDKTMVIRAYGKRLSGAARPANWHTSPVVESKYDVTIVEPAEPATLSIVANMGLVLCNSASIYEHFEDGGTINVTIPDGDLVDMIFFRNAVRDDKVVGTLSHVYRDGVDILTQLTSYPDDNYGAQYPYRIKEDVDGRHPQFVLVYDAVPQDDGMLTASLVPSKNWPLVFNDGVVNDYSSVSRVVKFAKGSNVVITPENWGTCCFDAHLYVNGVDRTEDLVDGTNGEKELHLQNVTEDLLIEAKYELKQLAVGVCSSQGGTVKAFYTRMGGTTTNYLTPSDGGGKLVTEIQPGEDMTFIFQAQEGYELGLVFCHNQRYIGEDPGNVQLQSDGTYQFVLHADEIVSEKTSVTAIYKKIGTDVNYDLNNDGKVDVADVTMLVNEVLKQ